MNEDIETIKELYKELKPKFDVYLAENPVSDKGMEKECRSMLMQYMEAAERHIELYEHANKHRKMIHAHSALYFLGEVEREINLE